MTSVLREYRERSGKTLAEVASVLGTSAASLSRIENGKQTLNPNHLPALRDLIGLPPSEARPDLAALLSETSE